MLTITVAAEEVYDESTETFRYVGGFKLELEHSLVALSKWESEFEKPLIGTEKTAEETLGYVRAMCLTPDVSDELLFKLSARNYKEINAYIDARMSATWFNESAQPRSREVITSELIYYWMIAFDIPIECETWHLERLFNLIKICGIKQARPQKMSRSQIAARNRKLNEERRRQLGSTG